MWDRYIREERLEFERVVAQKCYWWILINAHLVIFIGGKRLDIKLPIPEIYGNPKWHDEWKYKKHNEAELARVKAIWSQLTELIREKKQKIEAGESTVEAEFKEGIFFEDGKYGVKCKGSWI